MYSIFYILVLISQASLPRYRHLTNVDEQNLREFIYILIGILCQSYHTEETLSNLSQDGIKPKKVLHRLGSLRLIYVSVLSFLSLSFQKILKMCLYSKGKTHVLWNTSMPS